MYTVKFNVAREHGSGIVDFFTELPKLMKSAKTWQLDKGKQPDNSAVIRHTGTDKAVEGKQPKFQLTGLERQYVTVTQIEAEGWEEEEQIIALGHVVYLFMTALKSFAHKIEITY